MGKVILIFCVIIFLICSGVNAYNLPSDSCLEWAFGKNAGSLGTWEIDDEWNKRHKDIFKIYGYDILEEALDRIEKVCEERGI